MSEIRTVTLELLRHGPPHNQLLSPLTPYLCLCGNHSAVTVNMPFEHNQLLMRLNALRYKDSPDTWRLQLNDTARVLATVLSAVPGLIAELADGMGSAPPLTHLRMILSASELALVPFEMADAPAGFPGAGHPLLLQKQSPICITREVRRVGGPSFQWPSNPRILFAAASPAGVAAVPLEAHLLALRRAIDPWVKKDLKGRADMRHLRNNLVVIPNASVESILNACRSERFTHVHLLAHGARVPNEQERYGLVLHASEDLEQQDIVSGERLAQVLRTYSDSGSNQLVRPAVVTIAACEGADQGSVVGAGASVAHTLHEAGVPFVVASQFPLSFDASVLLTDILYRGLLWGNDPRMLLSDLRWQLKGRLSNTHDWASLVAYAALPTDFEDQLWEFRVNQTYWYFNTALLYLDRMTKKLVNSEVGRDTKRIQKRASQVIRKAKKRFQLLLEEGPTERSPLRALIHHMLGMAFKWDAKIRFSASRSDVIAVSGTRRGPIVDLLRRAKRHYSLSFQTDESEIYPLVQELSLKAVLDGPEGFESQAWWQKWATARTLGEMYVARQPVGAHEDLDDFLNARSDLLELYLLGQLRVSDPERSDWMRLALEQAGYLAEYKDDYPGIIDATRSQLTFYTEFYNKCDPQLASLEEPAKQLLQRLSN